MYFDDIYDIFAKNFFFEIGKTLGYGAYGIIKEVRFKGKIYAGKLIEKRKEKINESDLIHDLKGPNIVRIIKIFEKKINNKIYELILLEKATLYDLQKFKGLLSNNLFLKINYMSPIKGEFEDNLLRFFTIQIVKGIETLDKGDYIHFDIKPTNILIFVNMVLKITDFGLLRNINEMERDKNKVRIPGGTLGYLSPEFYQNHRVSIENLKKQDYFSLGSTLFYLKYGESMLNYREYDDNLMTEEYIIDLLQKAIDQIKSVKNTDKDFINFICNLIQYKPEERYNLEEIYRNKWLNKNRELITEIFDTNKLDEYKLLIELTKSDYLIDKQKYFESLEINKNINTNNNKNEINDYNMNKKKINLYRKNKFIFKKKHYNY